MAPELLEFGPIPPEYVDPSTNLFVKDFWMKNRIGAMIGASMSDYIHAQAVYGFLGGIPRHLRVVGPDVEGLDWNGVMTSPGTNGWIPEGAEYRYSKDLDAGGNYTAWVAAGAPKYNKYGTWATQGLPQAYVEETWKHPSDRDLSQFCAQYGLGCSDGKKRKNK